MKYLPLYEEWMSRGNFPFLCHEFTDCCGNPNDELFELFLPTEKELEQHVVDGYSRYGWGTYPQWPWSHSPTPLRQNIVLFMAAMNGEL